VTRPEGGEAVTMSEAALSKSLDDLIKEQRQKRKVSFYK
jgi:hypothetical protein